MSFSIVNQVSAFNDVKSFKEDITKLVDAGIIFGYPDGTFRPNQYITRAQTVQMIIREMKITSSQSKINFSDVRPGTNGAKEIAIGVERGFINGFKDGTFRPNERLTRAQMAIILVKAYGLKGNGEIEFSDVGKNHGAKAYIEAMAASGVTAGYKDGTFKPEDFVSRSHFSAFLSRVMEINAQGNVTPEEPVEIPKGEPQDEPIENPIEEPIEEPIEDQVEQPVELPNGNASISYKGITDVKSRFADNQVIENVHYYVVNMGEGNPINIYVTQDYEKRFGKGFAYEETITIIHSIEKQRNAKPYTERLGMLDIFFYTNESNTALPKDHQAVIGSWDGNYGNGVPTEMLMNGSTMPYDFRSSYVHEFIHFFDYQSFILEGQHVFQKYWGDNYRFWLLEGGAEYGSYFFYDYPTNLKNNLSKNFVQPNRDSILNYAFAQGGRQEKLVYDMEMNSFDDIYKASSNNYGITLSLFWFLVEKFGYNELYDYVHDISKEFSNTNNITQDQKNRMAIKHFGKTEEAILKDWLVYFDYFGGDFKEFKETETGTAKYILKQGDSLTPNGVSQQFGNQQNGDYVFGVNLSNWIPNMGDNQALSFREKSTFTFTLVADGHESVEINRNTAFYTGGLNNQEQLYAFGFVISPSAQKKLVDGVSYTIVPSNNTTKYQWVIPNEVKLEWNK